MSVLLRCEKYCVANAVLIAVILNLVLPLVLSPLATEEEVNPPGCPSKLSYKSQFMHMMVHHQKVPFTSSVIVGLIVGLSVFLGYRLKPMNKMMSII